jgi:DNA-binding HxlR family transcriptional regulator
VRVEYQLTDKGRALEKVFAAVGDWADAWGCPAASKDDPEAA